METLEQFRITSRPGATGDVSDKEIAAALHKAAKLLGVDELAEIMGIVARDRLFAIPYIFRTTDLPAAHAPLLAALDERGHLPWTIHFLREALRRDRIVEATSIYNDIAKFTSIPGARKRLADIVSRHVVDGALLEAIQVSIERPEAMPEHPDGAQFRPVICAWLAIDGSQRSLDSLRRYGEILSHGTVFARHAGEIVQECAANDDTRAAGYALARMHVR